MSGFFDMKNRPRLKAVEICRDNKEVEERAKNNPECEKLAIVCMYITEPLLLPDNLTGTCVECGKGVQYRPDAPQGDHVCFSCMEKCAGEEFTMLVTEKQQRDLEARGGDMWSFMNQWNARK